MQAFDPHRAALHGAVSALRAMWKSRHHRKNCCSHAVMRARHCDIVTCSHSVRAMSQTWSVRTTAGACLQAELRQQAPARDETGPYFDAGAVTRLERRALQAHDSRCFNLAHSLWGRRQMAALQVRAARAVLCHHLADFISKTFRCTVDPVSRLHAAWRAHRGCAACTIQPAIDKLLRDRLQMYNACCRS